MVDVVKFEKGKKGGNIIENGFCKTVRILFCSICNMGISTCLSTTLLLSFFIDSLPPFSYYPILFSSLHFLKFYYFLNQISLNYRNYSLFFSKIPIYFCKNSLQ